MHLNPLCESGILFAVTCGCSSTVELQPSKLAAWVRLPSPAPQHNHRVRPHLAGGHFVYGGSIFSFETDVAAPDDARFKRGCLDCRLVNESPGNQTRHTAPCGRRRGTRRLPDHCCDRELVGCKDMFYFSRRSSLAHESVAFPGPYGHRGHSDVGRRRRDRTSHHAFRPSSCALGCEDFDFGCSVRRLLRCPHGHRRCDGPGHHRAGYEHVALLRVCCAMVAIPPLALVLDVCRSARV